MSPGTEGEQWAALRRAIAQLPRADNHKPGQVVDPAQIWFPDWHRVVLDPKRALVVGNRGMGKSFWAHALATPTARAHLAKQAHDLAQCDVEVGFNASARPAAIAPTPSEIAEALNAGCPVDAIWKAVLVRVAHAKGIDEASAAAPDPFLDLIRWIATNLAATDRILSALDDRYAASSRKLVIVFDALDRLAMNWKQVREVTQALLRLVLAAQSYRALRLKIFMRRDQFEDTRLFSFPDGSKIRNTRVDLHWSPNDLYALLLSRIAANPEGRESLIALRARLGQTSIDTHQSVIEALAGKFMGSGPKRGAVFTWLPTHLSDARGEISPRTFLSAWREAALHNPEPVGRAVDHLGLNEGVRKASEDRLSELREDYWWIEPALAPLRGESVPILPENLEDLWAKAKTIETIVADSPERGLAPVQLEEEDDLRKHGTGPLVSALQAIGVMERRNNGKLNIPDIFRVEAMIKRKGGVRPPVRR